MQKAIIIDDEENARIALSFLLQQYVPEIEIAAQCSNVPDGVLAINKHNPDIVFLDVEMPEYNGFELLGFFKEISFQIIFVTAYNQYAVRAFEVSATDYLLKPVEIDSLKAAVEKAKKRVNSEALSQRLELLQSTYTGSDIQKIALPVSNGLQFIETDRIAYFEADRVYTHIFLTNNSKLTITKPLRVFEEMLDNRPFFFRPHRSYLINIHHIQKYLRGESIIVMDGNQNIPVSRERKADFERLLKELRVAL